MAVGAAAVVGTAAVGAVAVVGTAAVGDTAVVGPVAVVDPAAVGAVAETAEETGIAQVLQVFGELGSGLFLLCSTVP